MSFSFGSQKQKQQSTQQVDPWAPTQPLLKEMIGGLGDAYKTADTSGVASAIDAQKAAIGQANPAAAAGTNVAQGILNGTNYAPQVASAYGDFQRRLAPTADGTNTDVMNNPQLQALLKQVGTDAAEGINAQFAAAGRDLSGYNQRAVAEGVSRAQTPLLLDQFNRETARSDAAARDLFQGGTGAATTQAGLDAQKAGLDTGAVGLLDQINKDRIAQGQEAIDLEQLKAQIPYMNEGWLAQLLYPAAGLGGTQTGTATGTKSGFSLGMKLV